MIARRDSGSTLLRIEDTTSAVVYSGTWTSSKRTDPDYNDDDDHEMSLHTSTTVGSTVKFAFNGSFVAVYGFIDDDSMDASFVLDDQPTVTQSVSKPPSAEYNYPFFSSTGLLDTTVSHELTVTVTGGTFNLDYIIYTSTDGAADSGNAARVQDLPTASTASASANATATATSSSSSQATLSPGAIAALSIAGALVLALVLLQQWWVRRRRGQRVRHWHPTSEKPIEILGEAEALELPAPARQGPLRALSRVYRATPPRSTQSSKTASSGRTSGTQSSAMFTSVIMLSPALSMVSEETGPDASYRV